ncbi:MAG: hypothetical protein JWM80_5122 [Cyanobacteria bacterium RYN_339]|nr:hypothetical protein [Cyanobacteria bacterium RYN_339]
MRKTACALAIAAAVLFGCPKAQAPTPGEMAGQLRTDVPSYGALHRAASDGPARNVLFQHESVLAELPLGATQGQVHQRYGDPNRMQRTGDGEWWEFDEVTAIATPEPIESGRRKPPVPHNPIGTLRLLFQPREQAVDAAATDAAKPRPAIQSLVQIQAWAPGAQETASMIRLLDPVARVERKYGAPPRKLGVGWGGAEVWLYPAANVAFVITAPQAQDEPELPPQRVVAGTIVGL